jgi:hypothetical protein
MDELLPTLAWQVRIRHDVFVLRELFDIAMLLPFCVVLGCGLVQAIRWANRDPELSRARSLWLSLWCGGLLALLTGLVSLVHVSAARG